MKVNFERNLFAVVHVEITTTLENGLSFSCSGAALQQSLNQIRVAAFRRPSTFACYELIFVLLSCCFNRTWRWFPFSHSPVSKPTVEAPFVSNDRYLLPLTLWKCSGQVHLGWIIIRVAFLWWPVRLWFWYRRPIPYTRSLPSQQLRQIQDSNRFSLKMKGTFNCDIFPFVHQLDISVHLIHFQKTGSGLTKAHFVGGHLFVESCLCFQLWQKHATQRTEIDLHEE